MNLLVQVGLTILGGTIAGLVGLWLFRLQRHSQLEDERVQAKKNALREFREALMPLMIELDRWRFQGAAEAAWVGSIRELPSLNTWVYDPVENASKTPDWDSIGLHGQAVERLWRDRLADRAGNGEIDAQWSAISRLIFHVIRPDGADPRTTAERAEVQIRDLLTKIQKVLE